MLVWFAWFPLAVLGASASACGSNTSGLVVDISLGDPANPIWRDVVFDHLTLIVQGTARRALCFGGSFDPAAVAVVEAPDDGARDPCADAALRRTAARLTDPARAGERLRRVVVDAPADAQVAVTATLALGGAALREGFAYARGESTGVAGADFPVLRLALTPPPTASPPFGPSCLVDLGSGDVQVDSAACDGLTRGERCDPNTSGQTRTPRAACEADERGVSFGSDTSCVSSLLAGAGGSAALTWAGPARQVAGSCARLTLRAHFARCEQGKCTADCRTSSASVLAGLVALPNDPDDVGDASTELVSCLPPSVEPLTFSVVVPNIGDRDVQPALFMDGSASPDPQACSFYLEAVRVDGVPCSPAR